MPDVVAVDGPGGEAPDNWAEEETSRSRWEKTTEVVSQGFPRNTKPFSEFENTLSCQRA